VDTAVLLSGYSVSWSAVMEGRETYLDNDTGVLGGQTISESTLDKEPYRLQVC